MENIEWPNYILKLFIYIFIILLNTAPAFCAKISDLRLCADNDCKTVLSLAKTLARHQNNDPVFLSFSRGEVVQVLSKSAGNRPDLWGGQIGDRKGYFPRSFVREYKVDIPNPGQIVPTQGPEQGQAVPGEKGNIEKDETELDDDTDVSDDEGYQTGDESREEDKDSERSKSHTEDETNQQNDDRESKQDETDIEDSKGEEGKVNADEDETELDGDETEIDDSGEDQVEETKTDEDKKETNRENDNKSQIEDNQLNKNVHQQEESNNIIKQSTVEKQNLQSDQKTQDQNPHDTQSDEIKQDVPTDQKPVKEQSDHTQQDVPSYQKPLQAQSDQTKQDVPADQKPLQVQSGQTKQDVPTDQKPLQAQSDQTKQVETTDQKPLQAQSDMAKQDVPTDQKRQSDQSQQSIPTDHTSQVQTDQTPQPVEIQSGNNNDQVKEGKAEGQVIESKEGLQIEDGDSVTNRQITGQQRSEQYVYQEGTMGGLSAEAQIPGQQKQQADKTTVHKITPSPVLEKQTSVQEGFTIIDGTPFPIDIFEETQKTPDSTPVIMATKTETIVASQMAGKVLEQENIKEGQTVNGTPVETKKIDKKVDGQEKQGISQQAKHIIDGQMKDILSSPNLVDRQQNDIALEPQKKGGMVERSAEKTTNAFHPDVEDVTDDFLKSATDNNQTNTDKPVQPGTPVDLEKPIEQPSSQKQQTGTQVNGDKPVQQPDLPLQESGISVNKNIPVQTGSQQEETGSTVNNDKPVQQPDLPPQESSIPVNNDKPVQMGSPEQQSASPDKPEIPPGTLSGQTDSINNQKPPDSVEKLTVTTEDKKIVEEQDIAKSDLQISISVAEQLVSSMSTDIPSKPEKQNATVILDDNTGSMFGIANVTDKTLPDSKPVVHDIYTTDDFLTRKPLSHNTGTNVASVKNEDTGITDTQGNSPPPDREQSIQKETPPPPDQELHVLTRKITDDNLEEEEDKEYRDKQSWRASINGVETKLKNIVEKLPPSIQSLLEQEPLGLTPQMTVLVTILTISVLMLATCVTCICGSKKKTKKTDPVVVVRSLEEKLFIATKERENLEDELEISNKRVIELEEKVKVQTSSSGTIATEVDRYKTLLKEYEDSSSSQQNDIENLNTELSKKTNDIQSKAKKLEEIQKQLKKKEQSVENLSEKLKTANKDLDSVKTELKSEKNQNSSLTKQIEQLETSKQQLLQEAEGWNEKFQDLTERYETLEKGQTQMQEDLAFKENELEVLRDCFLQLKAFEKEDSEDQDETDSKSIQDKLKSMMDVSVVNARLRTVEDERNLLQNKVDIEVQSRMDMEEQIAELESKIEGMKTDKMKAERQSNEATTKLNVLSNYFKEKETQLQRELGEQEALKKQNINKLENADEVAKMIQEELESYKLQTEDLKKEILSAERDFRSQIAANEKKAHDNWLSARAAERELKESRHECSVLRQKLTDLERRLMHGPSGLIRPLPTRGIPPPGMINGPLPPDRPGSRSGPFPPPAMRDEDIRGTPGPVRLPPPDRRGPRMPPPDLRSPPPFGRGIPPPMDRRSPPPGSRGPPPPMDRRSPPPGIRGPMDRGPPPLMDRRSPPPFDRLRGPPGYRPPPDMLPPHLRGPPPSHGPSSPSPRIDLSGTPRHRTQDQEVENTPRQSSQV